MPDTAPRWQQALNNLTQDMMVELVKRTGEAPAGIIVVAVWSDGSRPAALVTPKLDTAKLMAIGDLLLQGAIDAVKRWKLAVNTKRENA